MSSPAKERIKITCPGCGGRFEVSAELGGKVGRCQQCGTSITIPGGQVVTPKQPEFVGVSCHVCTTLLYGRQEHIGRLLKCPDCGAATRLPPPPPPKPKNIPAAMEGEQYELWDDAESTNPDAGSPPERLLPVSCQLCETLMYATEKQIGEMLVCPDCGRRNQVVKPAASPPRPSVLVPTSAAYMVDPSIVPPTRPPVLSPEAEARIQAELAAGTGGSLHDDDQEARRQRKRHLDARGRPILPRFPLVTGVVGFLFSPGVLPRWCALSMALVAVLALFVYAITSLGGLAAPVGGGFVSSGMGAISGFFFLIASMVVGTIVAAASAAICLAIAVESCEGNDEVYAWPTMNFTDWLSESFHLSMAILVSCFPGWLIARLLAADAAEQTLIMLAGCMVSFPIVLLSQLAASSPAAVLSFAVLASLWKKPFTWLFFWVQSALLMALCITPVVLAARSSPWAAVLMAPWVVPWLFIYFRLLGRLGWCIAEAANEQPQEREDREPSDSLEPDA